MSKCFSCRTQIAESGQDTSFEWNGEAVCGGCYIEYSDNKIAELKAELALHQWISVEDRLPEATGVMGNITGWDKSDKVLVTDGNSYRLAHWYQERDQWGICDCNHIKPTHWMPIPTLPEPKEPTFLPDCKWQNLEDNVVMCRDKRGAHWGVHHGGACDKNCANPEPKEQD